MSIVPAVDAGAAGVAALARPTNGSGRPSRSIRATQPGDHLDTRM
jgi:hypothetical protein